MRLSPSKFVNNAHIHVFMYRFIGITLSAVEFIEILFLLAILQVILVIRISLSLSGENYDL